MNITDNRLMELFDNMLFHITELVSNSDLIDTLHCIGFTDEEIKILDIEVYENE